MSYYYWPAPEDAPRERQSLDPNWKLVHINTCGTSRGVPAWVGNEATADKCRRPKGGAGMYLWNSWPNEAPWPRWSRRATLRWDTGTSDWNPVDHSRHLSTTSFNNERATSTMKSSAKGGPRKKKRHGPVRSNEHRPATRYPGWRASNEDPICHWRER